MQAWVSSEQAIELLWSEMYVTWKFSCLYSLNIDHTGRDRGWIVNKLPNLGSAGDDFFSKKKYIIVYFKKSKYFSFRILMFFYVLIYRALF